MNAHQLECQHADLTNALFRDERKKRRAKR